MQLNTVGWSALFGACAAAGAIGVAATRLTRQSTWPGLMLAPTPVAWLVIVDRRRWAVMEARTSVREQDLGDGAQE